ncbi:hypothetical protein C8Q74DRAFT_593652 [Fomes fomentarius]|nr:hypothetical protein C8Q74DRAFT_593652 [Fomes fomentarius]
MLPTLPMSTLRKTDSEETLLPLLMTPVDETEDETTKPELSRPSTSTASARNAKPDGDEGKEGEGEGRADQPPPYTFPLLCVRLPLPTFLAQREIAAEYEQLACEHARTCTQPSDGETGYTPSASRLESQTCPRCPGSGCVSSSSSRSSKHFPSISVVAALCALIWCIRMLLVLVLFTTMATFPVCFLTYFLGKFPGLLYLVQPYTSLSYSAAASAGTLGSAVLGPTVGVAWWVKTVWRRARIMKAERYEMSGVGQMEGVSLDGGDEARTSQQRQWERVSTRTSGEDEPLELSYALATAIIAGAFAMAVGFALKPSLLPIAPDAGASAGDVDGIGGGEGAAAAAFGVKHAVLLGVWGFCVPFMPCAFASLVSTVWKCDPGAGAECALEACCSSCSR